MRKRLLSLITLLILILPAACGPQVPGGSEPGSTDREEVPGQDETSAAFYTGKIISVQGDSLLLAGTGEETAAGNGVVTVPLTGISLLTEQGDDAAREEFTPGKLVKAAYDGTIQETFPGGLSHVSSLRLTGQEEDLTGLYLNVLSDLYAVDEGLNSDINVLAFDLSKCVNLSESEKAAFVWLAGQTYGYDTVTGTFDELQEQGYIDKEELYFAHGLLIRLDDTPIKNGRFSFNMEKWRSGLGAYYFTDCTAKKEGGKWTYTVGAEAIS